MRSVSIVALGIAAAAWGSDLQPLSSAEICGRCHRSILEAWKGSAHARAMDSPLFQDGLELTEAEFGRGARQICLGCHSPIAVITKDTALRQKVSWEGVTCEYCHSLRDVSMAGANPRARVEFSLVKSGPLKDAVAPVHGTLFSPVHSSSIACAPCHEYRNSLGFAVLTTYSEWKNSRHGKEGRNCQSCHMFQVAGDVVDPKVRQSTGARVNLHEMPGSRSLDQLNKTIKARLSTSREGGQVKVVVEIANAAAGHFVPTGSPMRQLILEVGAVSNDGRRFREERVYTRVVADKEGKPLTLEPGAFLKGAKAVSDTRLAPDEKRTENFSFPVPPGGQTEVVVALRYYYSPLAKIESQQRVTFWTARRIVR